MQELSFEEFFGKLGDRTEAKPHPLQGHWDLTYQCNLLCRHCYLAGVTQSQELNYREATSIIDQLSDEGCLQLTFSGGEPLLKPEFQDIYSYARKKGILLTLFTNGTLITKTIAAWLSQQPPLMIEITVHSLKPEVFERISGVEGSFSRCMRGIEILKSYKLPLALKTVGMKDNKDDIYAVKEFASQLGNNRFKFDSCIIACHSGSKAPCSLRLSPEEAAAIEFYDYHMNKQWRDYLESEDCKATDSTTLFSCEGGLTSFYISPYGELRMCLPMVQPAFNLRTGSFREGFYSFLQELRRRDYTKDSPCRGCSLVSFCGQCPAKALLENGDMQEPVEYLCALAKERAEIFQEKRWEG
jgi:radical SAM protein with 4Fe4S-binding SPASM domain